jgi:hypothetical protein
MQPFILSFDYLLDATFDQDRSGDVLIIRSGLHGIRELVKVYNILIVI